MMQSSKNIFHLDLIIFAYLLPIKLLVSGVINIQDNLVSVLHMLVQPSFPLQSPLLVENGYFQS